MTYVDWIELAAFAYVYALMWGFAFYSLCNAPPEAKRVIMFLLAGASPVLFPIAIVGSYLSERRQKRLRQANPWNV